MKSPDSVVGEISPTDTLKIDVQALAYPFRNILPPVILETTTLGTVEWEQVRYDAFSNRIVRENVRHHGFEQMVLAKPLQTLGDEGWEMYGERLRQKLQAFSDAYHALSETG